MEGDKHEPPFGHARVRNLQLAAAHHGRAVEQDIDIDDARPLGYRAHAAEHALDLLHSRQKLQGKQRGLGFYHKVEEPALIVTSTGSVS